MIGCRWILLGLLAALAVTGQLTLAAPQEGDGDVLLGDWFEPNPDIDYDDFITEDEMSEDDLNEIADEIAEEIQMDNDNARGKLGGAFKVVGKGFVKGSKKVGSALLTAGKKVVKVSGKGLKLAGKGLKKVGKATGKGLKKVGKGAGKGLLKVGKVAGKGLKKVGKGALKVGKKTKQVMTSKGKKIWGSLKTKMNGELGKAGKQLLKKVGKEVLEQGMSLAVEAVTPMIIEYVMDKTQEGLCSCENTTCTCCAQPPGFEKGCLVVRVRPVKKIMNAAITYNGEELAKLIISKEEGEGSCAQLTGLARFIQACITPVGIGEFEGGFRGCLSIGIEPISLERSMCVDFKGTRKDGSANFVSVAELDDIEMEAAEEGDEDEEDEE